MGDAPIKNVRFVFRLSQKGTSSANFPVAIFFIINVSNHGSRNQFTARTADSTSRSICKTIIQKFSKPNSALSASEFFEPELLELRWLPTEIITFCLIRGGRSRLLA